MATTEKEMACPKGYVEVIATARGFYGKGKNGSRIREEETFYVPEGSRLSAWFRPLHAKDEGRLLPCLKADKVRAKMSADADWRRAKDPGALVQTMRQVADALAPLQLGAGKVMEEPAQKKAPKPATASA